MLTPLDAEDEGSRGHCSPPICACGILCVGMLCMMRSDVNQAPPPTLSFTPYRQAAAPPGYPATDRRALEMPPCRSLPHTLPFRSSRPECLPAAPPRSPPSTPTWRYGGCLWVGAWVCHLPTLAGASLLEIELLCNPALTSKLPIMNEALCMATLELFKLGRTQTVSWLGWSRGC